MMIYKSFVLSAFRSFKDYVSYLHEDFKFRKWHPRGTIWPNRAQFDVHDVMRCKEHLFTSRQQHKPSIKHNAIGDLQLLLSYRSHPTLSYES
jgi:hypothetical protein